MKQALGPLCPKCGIKRMHKSSFTPGGKRRWICASSYGPRENKRTVMCYTTTDPSSPPRGRSTKTVIKEKVFKRSLAPVNRFIITAAQNATPIHANFWKSLCVAAAHLRAELMVIPIRYRNPTSQWSQAQETDEWWDPAVTSRLWNVRKKLNANLTLMADVKTQPTSAEPLRGMEAMSHSESAILGHTKLQMKTVPTPSNKMPKIMTTTGACTVQNYTDSRAGALGAFHHTLGAVLVEIQGKYFHLRHLNANKETGTFIDLGTMYSPEAASQAPRPLALVMGDTHVDYIDRDVERATFGKGGIIETLNPETLVWHDLLDAYAVNPHHRKNPFIGVAKRKRGLDDIHKEISRAVQFVVDRTGLKRQSVIIASNHNDFVTRYMMDQDWRSDPTNAWFYLKTAFHLVDNAAIDEHGFSMPSAMDYWFKQCTTPRMMERIKLLGRDESFLRGGVELSMHGDIGPAGVRGSARNLRRIGVKSIIGHSHSPCIDEGCYQVGTSTSLKLEYNQGPSAWLNTHCILHADGKRQLISIIDGKWRI